MKVSQIFLASVLLVGCAHTPEPAGKLMPTEFRHNRVFVTPTLPSGETITFYTDSGGGWNVISQSVVERLNLEPAAPMVRGDQKEAAVELPDFDPARSIPPPNPKYWQGGNLLVVPDKSIDEDGFLGGRWFAGRVWAFDYAAGTLRLLEQAKPWPGAARIPLGFQVNKNGKRTMNFARMSIEVDGESYDVLLDTGAGITLTADAATVFGLPEGTQVAGSFIIKSAFDRWVENHPDWLVVPGGDSIHEHTFPMIRVPEVSIGGISAGPVWFAVRPDHNFTQYMSRMMDAPVVGAIGGSAFQYYRVMIDYPNATAYFLNTE